MPNSTDLPANYFSRLPQKHDILWNDGPRLKAIHKKLEDAGLAPNEPGKGRNVWYCIGYALASQNADVVALHDCDITTYSREMLARLVYPVANPAFPYQFCKGYYPRIANGKLNGRVSPASGLAEIEAIGVHDLGPGGDEVVDELLLVVVLGVDLGIGAQDGVGAEHQVDAGRRPLDLAGLAVADLVGCRRWAPTCRPCRSG
jgi:hypothetical protein